jgi:hypothetical protein
MSGIIYIKELGENISTSFYSLASCRKYVFIDSVGGGPLSRVIPPWANALVLRRWHLLSLY